MNDFRTADVQAGGQGAPLVPVFHKALFSDSHLPVVVLNLGGVGNLTYIHGDELIAFDTGPGNGLLDQWIEKNTGDSFDFGGQKSLSGEVHEAILNEYMENIYFSIKPPKSLDRCDFSIDKVSVLNLEDGAATLAAFTATTVLDAFRYFPLTPQQCYVTGGGRHNEAIMSKLKLLLPCEVDNIDVLGFDGDMLEAQAFAYLAVRSINGLPFTLPTTTGVKKSLVVGGVFYPVELDHVS